MVYLRIRRISRLPSGDRLAFCDLVERDSFGLYRLAAPFSRAVYLLSPAIGVVRAHSKRVYRAALQDTCLDGLTPSIVSLTPI